MYEKFIQVLYNDLRIDKRSRILLAVSGGIDSMSLMDLFCRANVSSIVAHCNFGLRGTESDNDERLVVKQAKALNIPVFSKRFDTQSHALEKGISIQMAARELRYQYFEEIRLRENLDYIAIAHNKNDSIETLFINLCRETGLKGLASMKPFVSKQKIIRPLLWFTRDEIEEYALNNNIKFREDSSNATDKYARNAIRHHVIPKLEEIFPNAVEQISKSIGHLSQTSNFISNEINKIRKKIVTTEDQKKFVLNIHKLNEYDNVKFILFEILSKFGFTPDDIKRIYKSKNSQAGKKFESKEYILVKDRNKFLIEKKTEPANDTQYIIHSFEDFSIIKHIFDAQVIDWKQGNAIDRDVKNAMLDFDKIKFPLELRKWKDGDYFCPLGMNQKKKVSDFFVDNKISLTEKSRIWLLTEKNGTILWIVNYRIDNRFKITENTKKVLRLINSNVNIL